MLSWKFLSYIVYVPRFKVTEVLDSTKVSLSSSAITRSEYVGRNKVELIELSGTLNYEPLFKCCILKTVLHVFLLFRFVWDKISCSKNWAVFYICLIWFGVAFSVTVLKILCFWYCLCRLYEIRVSLALADIICWG